MAYTQIHAIKATVDKAVAYITNPNKTDESLLVSSFATAPETASFDFAATLSKTNRSHPNLAFHLIQSFAPGEVSPAEAHQIGHELADKLLEGKYSYVLGTHIDKNHVHNHIIFCAADFVEFKKFHSCKASNYKIRAISDELCRAHGLSVITPKYRNSQYYKEWADKKGSPIRDALRKDIDNCIQSANTYPVFLALMKAYGYEIKGESFDEGSLKYISFKPSYGKEFIRGCSRSLGEGYTKEEIVKRIEQKKDMKKAVPKLPPSTSPSPLNQPIKEYTVEELLSRKPKSLLEKPSNNIFDTNTEQMQSSPALLSWAKLQNLKTVAHLYATTEDLPSLNTKISDKRRILFSLQEQLSTLEKKLIPASEIAHAAAVCKDNISYETAMQKSKDPDSYYRTHSEQIGLYRSASDLLERKYGFHVATLDFDMIAERFSLMCEKKKTLQESIKNISAELKELDNTRKILEDYFGTNTKENTKSIKKNRGKPEPSL